MTERASVPEATSTPRGRWLAWLWGLQSVVLVTMLLALVINPSLAGGPDRYDQTAPAQPSTPAGPILSVNAEERGKKQGEYSLRRVVDSTLETKAQVEPPSIISDKPTLVGHALVGEVSAYETPSYDAPVVVSLQNPTKRGGPLVFQALAEPEDGWVEVLLPVRPNGTSGFVRAEELKLTVNPYRITVDATLHELTIYRESEAVLMTTIAIGTGETPTPIGSFYITELLQPSDPTGVYGPFAYGLSGFSETLDSFNGGEGVIGIHGTNNPDALGTDVSHGCVRLDNDVITDIVDFLPLGTPVWIYRDTDSISLDDLEVSREERTEPLVRQPIEKYPVAP